MSARSIQASVVVCLLLSAVMPPAIGAQALPGVPQNFSGSGGPSSLTVMWQAPATGAAPTGYLLDIGFASGVYEVSDLPVGLLMSISFPAPPGIYYFRVRAENAAGVGPSTPELAVTVGAGVELPSAPLNLTATSTSTSATSHTLFLSWDPPAIGAPITQYILQAGTAPGVYDLANQPVPFTSLSVAIPVGVYYFRVIAVNAAGQGPPTAEVSLTVGSTAPPSVPQNLTATAVTLSATSYMLNLSWDPPAVGAPLLHYLLQVGTLPGIYDLANQAVPFNSLSVAIPVGVYYFRVIAVNTAGQGPPTPEVRLTVGNTVPPSAPQNLTASAVSTSATNHILSLSWGAPATGGPLTYFGLQVGTSPGVYDLANVSLPASATSLSTAVPSGVYYLRLFAANTAGPGPPTPEIMVVVGNGVATPSAPLGLTGNGANHTLSLQWQPPATGALGARYVLQFGSAPGDYALFSGSTGTVTSVATPIGDGTYYARVGAENENGPGPFSPEIAVTVGPSCVTPAPPVMSVSRSGNVVTMSWTTPAGLPPTGYSLQLGSFTASTYRTYPVGLLNTLSGPASTGVYRMRVLASVACGFSAPSNEVSITVP